MIRSEMSQEETNVIISTTIKNLRIKRKKEICYQCVLSRWEE